MGIERWYVAVVDGSRLLERALSDPSFGVNVECPAYFHRERWRGPHRGPLEEFLTAVDDMNRSHPGIEDRIYTLDRWFDKLHYLLSEGRRRGELDGADLGSKAILGVASLPVHLRGSQGHPIHYSPPTEVGEIAAWLAGVTVGDLRSAYSPEEMERQSVYKHQSVGDHELDWSWIVEYFEGLRSYYSATASHGEGVLAIVT